MTADTATTARSPFAEHMYAVWSELAAWWRQHDPAMAQRCSEFAAEWEGGERVIRWEVDDEQPD